MTGNWWFPYDIFVVAQGNGDLKLYAPGILGAVYQWDAVSQAFTSPPGLFDKMVANGNGTWTRTTKDGTVWQFNAGGHVTSITNRYGLSTTFNRNAQNAITSIVDYAGRSTTVTYNGAGYVSAITDWGGRVTTFTYTAQGYLASISKPSTTFYDRQTATIVTRSKTITFTYTTGTGTARDGNLLTAVDDRGQNMVTNTYDASDRNTASTTRGRSWTYTYLANGTTKVVDPDGVTVIYSFDATGAIVRKEVFTQTGLGQAPLRVGEPNSYVWLYERASACGCGFISKITYPDGTTLSMTYDSWGNRLSETLDNGGSQIKRTWTYSPFSQFCRRLTYTKPRGHVAGATAADHTSTWTYDANGSVTQVQWPKATVNGTLQHPVVTFTRNAAGKPLSRTWPSGRKDTFTWAANTYYLTKITRDSVGLAVSRDYSMDTYGRLVSTTDPRGNTTTYAYNALDQLTERVPPQPKGAKTTLLYDNNGNLYRAEVENKDPTGTLDAANPWFTMTTAYDANNFRTGITVEIDVATTATTSFEWTSGGRLKKVTDPNGDVIELEYDERGLLFKRIDAPGTAVVGTTVYNYDVNGLLKSLVDPRGNTTEVDLDHGFRPIKVTYPDGTATATGYDADGNVILSEQLDTSAVVLARTTWVHDPFGLLAESARHHLDAQGTTTSTDTTTFTYDSGLRRTTITNPLSNATTITYDALSRPTQILDAAQNKIALVFDDNSNVVQRTRSDWNQVTSAYDAVVHVLTYDVLDRVVTTLRKDPANTLSSTTSTDFDGRGLPVKATDELGNTKHFAWDGRSLLLSVTHDVRAGGTGAGAVLSTIVNTRAYDPGGRLILLEDGKNNKTVYEYDARSRVKKIADPATGTKTFTFDANGNTLTATDAVGTVVTSVYDVMNRATSRTIAKGIGVLGNGAVTYTYDALGRLIKLVDDDSTVERTYDSLGRVLTETQGPNPLGGAGKTFAFGYNTAGSVTSVTYPDGTVEQRNRDTVERLASVAIQGGATLATYQYAGARVPKLTLTNSVVLARTFDALQRVTHIEYKKNTTSLKKFEYVFNLAGHRLLEKRHHAGGTGDNYALDSLYRTTTVKAGVADPVLEHQTPGSQTVASTTALTHDAANSRSQRVVTVGGTPTTTNYAVDALNFYTSVGGTTQLRDANGNLKDDGTHLYEYDFRNQLVRVKLKADSSVVAIYEYDALGRRIAKTTTVTTQFYWIGPQLAMEYDAAGLVSRRHLGREFGAVVSALQRDSGDLDQDGSTTDFVTLTPLYDGAFDCVGVLGPSGTVAESYVHTYEGVVSITDALGNPLATSAIKWNQGYGRMYRDDETGFSGGVPFFL